MSSALGATFVGFEALALPPGATPNDPILPPPDDDPSDGFDFASVPVTAGQLLFFDPVVAIGYDYFVADNLFESVLLPVLGDDRYELLLWDGADYVAAGSVAATVQHMFPTPVDRFRVLGIEPDLGLDPLDPTAFVTGLSFVEDGNATVRMVAITADITAAVGEPDALLLIVIGLGVLALTGCARPVARQFAYFRYCPYQSQSTRAT